jgi:hypothetical protein
LDSKHEKEGTEMAQTPKAQARIPAELEEAARAASPDLADVSMSVLVRVGLAALAGYDIADAIRQAGGQGVELPRDYRAKVSA